MKQNGIKAALISCDETWKSNQHPPDGCLIATIHDHPDEVQCTVDHFSTKGESRCSMQLSTMEKAWRLSMRSMNITERPLKRISICFNQKKSEAPMPIDQGVQSETNFAAIYVVSWLQNTGRTRRRACRKPS